MGRSRDVERFDQWAETYDRHWMQRIFFDPVQERVLDLAAAEVARPRAILDVGCGTGRLLRKAAARFPDADLLGVDPAPQMLKQAATAAEDSGIHFMEAAAEDLPFPDDRFDLIFSTLTFHHWSDQARAVGEVARVLTPGGRWLLADFVAKGLLRYIRRLFRIRRFPDRDSLDVILRPAGLRVLHDRPASRFRPWLRVLVIGR